MEFNNKLLLQWQFFGLVGGNNYITFPIAFPTAVRGIFLSHWNRNGNENTVGVFLITAATSTSCYVKTWHVKDNRTYGTDVNGYCIALGY